MIDRRSTGSAENTLFAAQSAESSKAPGAVDPGVSHIAGLAGATATTGWGSRSAASSAPKPAADDATDDTT